VNEQAPISDTYYSVIVRHPTNESPPSERELTSRLKGMPLVMRVSVASMGTEPVSVKPGR
jgi:hypothetical protein